MKTRVILAGATGWAGSALARGIGAADDLELIGAVARKSAGLRLGDVLGEPSLACSVYATAADALSAAQWTGHPERGLGEPESKGVFVEYTLPEIARANIAAALD